MGKYDKYSKYRKEISEDGINWFSTDIYEYYLIEENSEDCGYVPEGRETKIYYSNGNVSAYTITTIPVQWKYNQTRITKVEIGNTVTIINHNAFEGCTNLTSVTIPNSVTSIDSECFMSCSKLTDVTLGNGITELSSRIFYKCTSLTSINYNGTISQWNAITKGRDWKYLVPESCVVHCTDGNTNI